MSPTKKKRSLAKIIVFTLVAMCLAGAAVRYITHHRNPIRNIYLRLEARDIHHNNRLIAIGKLVCQLPIGITKAIVSKKVCPPDNIDNEFIWYWGGSFGLKYLREDGGRCLATQYIPPGGFFVIFDKKGRLLSPPLKSAHGWTLYDTYEQFGKGEFTREEVQAIIEGKPIPPVQ